MPDRASSRVLTDGSRVMVESLARAGVDAYIGYPITPANWIYAYAQQRIPIALAAPDEITTLQWACGIAATGKLPLTATSFPGYALMLETVNMAYLMELPLVIVLVQRLGPSTGSATTGAQGDLLLLRGSISGGYPLPVFCPSSVERCWDLAAHAARTAVALRTPVILLTSKEMVMTSKSLDLADLGDIDPASWPLFEGTGEYRSYDPGPDHVPPFLPVGHPTHQVRLNASTHEVHGLIRKATPDALANSRRLRTKIEAAADRFDRYLLEEDPAARTLIVAYGITAEAARDAVRLARERGQATSLLVLESLIPLPGGVHDILARYDDVLIAEENDTGLLAEMLFGTDRPPTVRSLGGIGHLITPHEICQEVTR